MATPVQVLIDLGYLSEADYERWRFGEIDHLERVVKVNLHEISFIIKQVRAYVKNDGLKPSASSNASILSPMSSGAIIYARPARPPA